MSVNGGRSQSSIPIPSTTNFWNIPKTEQWFTGGILDSTRLAFGSMTNNHQRLLVNDGTLYVDFDGISAGNAPFAIAAGAGLDQLSSTQIVLA